LVFCTLADPDQCRRQGKLRRTQGELETAHQRIDSLQQLADGASAFRVEAEELRHMVTSLFKQQQSASLSPTPTVVLAMDEPGATEFGQPAGFSFVSEVRYSADEHVVRLQKVCWVLLFCSWPSRFSCPDAGAGGNH
jgi:hypothetical protein